METIEIRNFGPIKHVKLDLKDINIFIGPTASGKSKGSDVVSAFLQIRNTFEYLKSRLKNTSLPGEGVVVSSRVPKSANPRVNRLNEEYRSKYKLKIQVKNQQYDLQV